MRCLPQSPPAAVAILPAGSGAPDDARGRRPRAPRAVGQGDTLNILALNWRCPRHPQAGGAETSLFAQARCWAADGHRVTIVCADPGRAHAPRREVIDGVAVRRMGGRFTVYLRAALYVLRYGRRFDRILDVANGIPFFTPLLTGTPTVLCVHHVHRQQWYSEFPRPLATIGWFAERRVVPRVYRRRAVIAISPTTEEALVDIGFARARIEIVYSGVERPPLAPDPSAVPAARGPRIAYVGRLKTYKRLDLLLHAAAALRAEFPGLRVDIAGDGDARPSLAALVARLGLGECVTLHGFVDDTTKDRILREATVFATPSMHEGWGLSAIEANTYGCPAVAYDVPGLRVAIQHGATGLLARDDDGFRQALATLLRDPALRARLGADAREWAARFDWATCARSTLRVLRASGARAALTGLTRRA